MTAEIGQPSNDASSHSDPTDRPPGGQGSQPAPTAGQMNPAANPVKVLVVEDSPVIRERLVALIADLPNIDIVGQAADGFNAQTLFRQHRPDAVVLDIQLPGINGLDLLAEFKVKDPACIVIVLTTYAFKEVRNRCAALGADHFFDKAMEFERVTEVLRTLPTRRGLKTGS